MQGMYGFDKKTWKHIYTNRYTHEVYIPSKGGLAKAKKRKAIWEERGHAVFLFEDKGVSVGIYIMKRENNKEGYYEERGIW